MLKQLGKLLLLGALLAALAAGSVPVLGANHGCDCAVNGKPHQGGCHWDAKAFQCVSTGCPGWCIEF